MMKPALKEKMRVGLISYLNCLPFYHQSQNDACLRDFPMEFYKAYPTKINLALRQGRIDAAPISSLEYLNYQDRYLLLPRLAIGSRDFSGSVLLLSHVKIEDLDGAQIALTRQSLSSAALLRILLRYKYKFKNRFISSSEDPETGLKKKQAVLVIGDQALLFQPRQFLYKYDLSELWWGWAEKPFCFSVWAVRREFAEENPEDVERFWKGLCRTRDRNLADLQEFLKESQGISFLDHRFAKLYGYFFNLYYDLDLAMKEGLELFYRLASRMGISPRLRRLEFFNVR